MDKCINAYYEGGYYFRCTVQVQTRYLCTCTSTRYITFVTINAGPAGHGYLDAPMYVLVLYD